MLELLLIAIAFVLASGCMAMMDAAILSVTLPEVEELVMQRQWGATALRAIVRRLTRAVVVIVILTNTVNVLGPILVGSKAVSLYGSHIIGVVTALLTFGTIIFSEVIPKAIGAHYAPTVARIVAPGLLFLTVLLTPIAVILERLVGIFKIGRRPMGTEEQIRALTRMGGKAGHIREAEGELIHRVFVLNDRRARDLMTPRAKVIALPADFTIREAIAEVARHPHTRYPIYDGSLDRVLGIVLNRDLYEALSKGREDEPITAVLREVITVEATMRSDALLMLFRRRNIHLAVVRDGKRTMGIVTLEDVLEELVGEIEDERDAGKILT